MVLTCGLSVGDCVHVGARRVSDATFPVGAHLQQLLEDFALVGQVIASALTFKENNFYFRLQSTVSAGVKIACCLAINIDKFGKI